jgi:hypothetical protein
LSNSRHSRSRIADIGTPAYKLLPAASRQRGLAAIGLELEKPDTIELVPVDDGTTIVRCSEHRDGKTVGELEVEVFKAALVIDRDGILEQKIHDVIDDERGRASIPVPVTLPGASGFRAVVELVRPMGTPKPELPYLYVFAVAPNDLAVDGGLLVTVRSAQASWPAADSILRTMRVLGRRGTANDDAAPLQLPVIGEDD